MKLFSRTNSGTVKQTIQLYREEARSEKKTIWMFSTLVPLGDFLYLILVPLLISFIVQSLIEQPHDITTPLWIVAALAIVSVAAVIINSIGKSYLFKHGERMTTKLTKRATTDLLKHSHSFFANQKVGSLAGDVNTFSRSYMGIVDTIFMQGSTIFVSFIASLIVIAFIAPLLLIPLMILTIFVIIDSVVSLNRRSAHRNKRKEMQSKLFGSIADTLGNQMLVRMFGRSKQEVNSIVTERRRVEDVAYQEIAIIERSAQIRMGGVFLFQVLIMLGCIYLVSHDMLSIAALVFTVTYLGRVTGAMFNVNSVIRTIEQAFLDAAKITEILAIDVDVRDKPHARQLIVKDAAITFTDVVFTYQDAQGQTVFENLGLRIESGQSIGLVGKSGGGKSTLTQLLLRYMDIQSGTITIDDQNIANVTQNSLRQAISYVPQDPYLFHRSLRENIMYGKEDASETELQDAITKAHAKEFIDKLPDGLDTIVGERGVKLSGGQRQRIAIARAILKDAPILILDEATSALDSESEQLIQSALENLMQNRTSIVIAHRLSTIAKLDRIIVLDNGEIVEDGTHASLRKRNGTYANLWKHQSGGFIEE